MMLKNGDKLVVTKKITGFLDEGDIAKVLDVNEEDGVISFAFGEDFVHMGIMTYDECESHFEKVEEKPNSVTWEQVEDIMFNSEIKIHTVFDKCTIVACKLPNGFVIVESSACVDPNNYDEDKGIDACLGKIADKIWELEGYNLQNEMAINEDNYPCDCDCENCGQCLHDVFDEDEEDYDADDDEFDECLDTDLDCDDCPELDCPYKSKL